MKNVPMQLIWVITDGNLKRAELSEFNSNNTELMTVEEVKEKLLTLSYVQNELKDWNK